jgi:hypothetical protein
MTTGAQLDADGKEREQVPRRAERGQDDAFRRRVACHARQRTRR